MISARKGEDYNIMSLNKTKMEKYSLTLGANILDEIIMMLSYMAKEIFTARRHD